MTLDEYRRFYAEEIRYDANLDSGALVEAFARVHREDFLGPGPWQTPIPRLGLEFELGNITCKTIDDPRHLYHNILIALDASRGLNSGHPGSLARWINALDLKEGESVFHLGCGVGYYTAIMTEVVGVNGTVIACEVDTGLAARAARNLAAYPNVQVHAVDGAAFDPGACDAMFINAGVTHPHPPWLDRLKQRGRMIVPITFAMNDKATAVGIMLKIVHNRNAFSAQVVSDVAIYSCTSVRDPQLEPLIGKALAARSLLKVKSVRRDSHEKTDSCILHREDVCLSLDEPAAAQLAATIEST